MLLHWKLALYNSSIPQNKAMNKYHDLFLSTYLQKRLGYSKKRGKKEKRTERDREIAHVSKISKKRVV
jgi:hypothetical protein